MGNWVGQRARAAATRRLIQGHWSEHNSYWVQEREDRREAGEHGQVARHAATRRLVQAHRTEYDLLYAEETERAERELVQIKREVLAHERTA